MTSTNWSSYAATAKEHSGGPNLPEDSGYTATVIGAKVTKAPKSGKYKFVWQFQVLTGPQAGKSEFLKQYLSPENGTALAIFRRVLLSLGIDMDSIPDGTPHESVANMAVGRTFTFDIKHKENPGYEDEVQFLSLKAVESVTSAPVAPVAPAPAPAAVAPAQPDLAAQLAALQAQMAAQGVEAPAGGSRLPW